MTSTGQHHGTWYIFFEYKYEFRIFLQFISQVIFALTNYNPLIMKSSLLKHNSFFWPTDDIDQNESQLWSQLLQLRKKAWG